MAEILELGRGLFTVPNNEEEISKEPEVPASSATQRQLVSFLVGRPELEPIAVKFLRANGGWSQYRDMRRDAVLSSCLELKTYLAIRNGWSVEAASDSPEHQRQAKFIQAALENLGVSAVIDKALDAVAIGFSVQEKVWGEHDGRLAIVRTVAQDPQTISFKVDSSWQVQEILITNFGDANRKPFPVQRFVYWVYNPLYEHPYGHGDFLEAYRPWYIKQQALILWARYLERTAWGTRLVKYKNGVQEDQQEAIRKQLTAPGSLRFAMFPDTLEVTIDNGGASQTGDVFQNAIKWANEEMARAILGATLAVDEGDRVGSKALGSVHMDTMLVQAQQLSRLVESEIVGKQIISPMMRVNFPGEREFPKFVLPQPSAAEMEALAQRVFGAIDRGVLSAEEQWIRPKLGFDADERSESERDADTAQRTIEEIANGSEAEED